MPLYVITFVCDKTMNGFMATNCSSNFPSLVARSSYNVIITVSLSELVRIMFLLKVSPLAPFDFTGPNVSIR